MADINTTLVLLAPLAEKITFFTELVKYLVGGIFGLYIILLILRWREYVVLVRIARDMNKKLDAITKKLGIKEPKKWTSKKR